MNRIITSINEQKENHNISIINREDLEISGVKKLDSLNDFEFFVSTSFGNMIIRGNNLEMKQLNIEKGILQIHGKINSLEYTDEIKKKEKSFLGKLFKW